MLHIGLALAMEIQRYNPALPEVTRLQYAEWVVEEAESKGLDPWVFHGIIATESRWAYYAFRRENDGSCSVGLGQINVKCTSPRAKSLKDPHENIKTMGSFLSTLKATCAHHCDGLGWLKRYNPGDSAYVPKKVEPIVQRCHVEHPKPALRAIQTRLHASRMCRDPEG